ncbi:MAG: ClbS/DfsB family four-helix bundle protein [Paraglaciecola sp.]|uniref:ClbS/DfsB family four-helix bundle protein n=1 Tax=Paraglaciecola sp. TaxID=1920173 RepID=UPI003297B9BC
MASVPTNKHELQLAIQQVFDKILVDYEDIPTNLSRTLGIEGNVKGTEISVSDTLAYLIGWGKLVIKWYRLSSTNQPVDFPESGYKWNELGKLAQSFHYEYRDWSYGDLLSEFKRTVNEVLSLIDSLSDYQLYGLAWYEKYTLGKMIQFNTSSPMKNMRAKVRKFKKNHGVT